MKLFALRKKNRRKRNGFPRSRRKRRQRKPSKSRKYEYYGDVKTPEGRVYGTRPDDHYDLADYAAFARKHVRDIFDRRWKNGCLPQIAPWSNEDFVIYGLNGSVGWACAGVYIPLYLYERYGDKRVLEEHYEDILDYADFMIHRAGKWGGFYSMPLHLSRENRKYAVNSGRSYGEWAEPADVKPIMWYDFVTSKPEESKKLPSAWRQTSRGKVPSRQR